LTNAVKLFGHKDAHYVGPLESAAQVLLEQVREGDLFLTLGAGTVYRVGDQLLELLKNQRSEARG
jgi:UDP-N-acetylmuramate--alanine ligase